jgi:hypothetical protein
MKLCDQSLTIAFLFTTVVTITDAYAGPEITGIPREPVDKGKMERVDAVGRPSTHPSAFLVHPCKAKYPLPIKCKGD